MSGKNIFYGTVLYLSTIFALYGTKSVTYKDNDAIASKIKSLS